MATKIFVNLPVNDLNKTKEFFSKLEYTYQRCLRDSGRFS